MSISCALATTDDHADLERLLATPMDTGWGLTYRLPNGLATCCDQLGIRWQAVIARLDGDPVACGFRFVRPVRYHGREELLGYLAWLRRTPAIAGVRFIGILRTCMQLLRSQRRTDELPWELTSIFADNDPARRLLERGIRDMPTYTACGRYRTVLMAASGRSRPDIQRRPGDDPACLARCARDDDWRLGPVASQPDIFLAQIEHGQVLACLGLQDDRRQRQTVVGNHPWGIGSTRRLLNTGRRWARRPRIPAIGEPINCLHIGPVATDDDRRLRHLLHAAGQQARACGADSLLAGACIDTDLDARLTRVATGNRSIACWYTVGDDAPATIQPAHQEVGAL